MSKKSFSNPYRFEGRIVAPASTALAVLLTIMGNVVIWWGDEPILETWPYVLMFLSFCMFAYFLPRISESVADLCVDEEGIYRLMFGRVINFYRWGEIKNIRQFVLSRNDGSGKMQTVYVIRPKIKRMHFFIIMSFRDRVLDGRVYDMLDEINKYINRHQIRVEGGKASRDGKGSWLPSDRLEKLTEDK